MTLVQAHVAIPCFKYRAKALYPKFGVSPAALSLQTIRFMGWSVMHLNGCGSKLNRRGYAGFGPCFHLPGQPILEFQFFEPQPNHTTLGVAERTT